jgi:hypothetical protein
MKSPAAARGRRSTTSSASWLLMDERFSTHTYVRASVCRISAGVWLSMSVLKCMLGLCATALPCASDAGYCVHVVWTCGSGYSIYCVYARVCMYVRILVFPIYTCFYFQLQRHTYVVFLAIKEYAFRKKLKFGSSLRKSIIKFMERSSYMVKIFFIYKYDDNNLLA